RLARSDARIVGLAAPSRAPRHPHVPPAPRAARIPSPVGPAVPGRPSRRGRTPGPRCLPETGAMVFRGVACARASVPGLLTLAPCRIAHAQAAITIDDAVREALDRNLTLLAERYSVGIAQAHVLAASLRPNPVFTYNLMLPDSAIYDNNINPIENV